MKSFSMMIFPCSSFSCWPLFSVMRALSRTISFCKELMLCSTRDLSFSSCSSWAVSRDGWLNATVKAERKPDYHLSSSSSVPKWVAVSWVSWQIESDHHLTLSSSLTRFAASAKTAAFDCTGLHYLIFASVVPLFSAPEVQDLLPSK